MVRIRNRISSCSDCAKYMKEVERLEDLLEKKEQDFKHQLAFQYHKGALEALEKSRPAAQDDMTHSSPGPLHPPLWSLDDTINRDNVEPSNNGAHHQFVKMPIHTSPVHMHPQKEGQKLSQPTKTVLLPAEHVLLERRQRNDMESVPSEIEERKRKKARPTRSPFIDETESTIDPMRTAVHTSHSTIVNSEATCESTGARRNTSSHDIPFQHSTHNNKPKSGSVTLTTEKPMMSKLSYSLSQHSQPHAPAHPHVVSPVSTLIPPSCPLPVGRRTTSTALKIPEALEKVEMVNNPTEYNWTLTVYQVNNKANSEVFMNPTFSYNSIEKCFMSVGIFQRPPNTSVGEFLHNRYTKSSTRDEQIKAVKKVFTLMETDGKMGFDLSCCAKGINERSLTLHSKTSVSFDNITNTQYMLHTSAPYSFQNYPTKRAYGPRDETKLKDDEYPMESVINFIFLYSTERGRASASAKRLALVSVEIRLFPKRRPKSKAKCLIRNKDDQIFHNLVK
eukprot:CFRG4726T1